MQGMIRFAIMSKTLIKYQVGNQETEIRIKYEKKKISRQARNVRKKSKPYESITKKNSPMHRRSENMALHTRLFGELSLNCIPASITR